MAGTISLSLSQQFDMDGDPLSGGLLYFFSAGTTTPQSAYQDFALTIPYPNPITLDASGRVPSFYLADGFIKIRLTDKTGVTVIAADQILVVGPSTGATGGGGGGVDPTTVLQTGDIKARYGTGVLAGFLRCNGTSMGNAASGATNASADNRALFEYLYPFTSLTVTPPRTGNASNDFDAGSQILLPDLRGRTIAGMDDMGSTSATRLHTAIASTVLGAAGGNQSQTLTAAQLPLHTHSGSGTTGDQTVDHTHAFSWGGTTSDQSADHTHQVSASGSNTLGGGAGSAGAAVSTLTTTGASNGHTHTYSGSGSTGGMSAGHQHGFSFTSNTGDGVSGSAHTIVQPTMVMTFYIKL